MKISVFKVFLEIKARSDTIEQEHDTLETYSGGSEGRRQDPRN